jgi:predicted Ser/Thr protein kinase
VVDRAAGNSSTEPDDAGPALAAPSHASDLGSLGKYRVLKLLGKGGMGAVFLGYDPLLERKVALKVMLPSFASRPAARERFLREARAAAKVKSDFVAPIYEVSDDLESPFLAMEYLLGRPLDQYLLAKGPLSVPQAVRIAREAAAGLAAAHALGLVHRDIKPANLWLEAPRGRVKILDFGLARQQDDATLTAEGQAAGTPAFMSPEQARAGKFDHRTDLFSLGAVLYLMLTGRLPFPGSTVMETLIRLTTDDPAPIRTSNPEVPEQLAELVHQLLAKDPSARPASAREVIAALKSGDAPLAVSAGPEYAADELTEPMATAPASPTQPSAVRRSRWPLVIGSTTAGIALFIAGVLVWPHLRSTGKAIDPPTVALREEGTLPKQEDGSKRDPGPGPISAAASFVAADLAGWDGDKSNWTAADGKLEGRPSGKGAVSVIWSQRRYSNFELAFRVRIEKETGAGLAVLFRATPGDDGLLRSFTGVELKFKPLSGVTLSSRDGDSKTKPLLPPTWLNPGGKDAPKLPAGKELDVVLRCEGKRVTVTLDGEKSADDEFDLPPEGVIGWSTGLATKVTFSDIHFIELARSPSPPPEPVVWKTLFKGKELTGWKAGASGERTIVWEGDQPVLRLQPGARFYTTEDYRDFHLSLEVQTPRKGGPVGNVSYHVTANNSRGFQVELIPEVFGKMNTWNKNGLITPGEVRNGRIVPRPAAVPTYDPPTIRGMEKAAGEWNLIEVVCLGDACVHAINGKVVFAATSLAWQGKPVGEGRLLLVAYGEMAVRDVKVRSIKALPESLGGPKAGPR